MKKLLESLGTVLVYIIMLWGEFGGIYHTYTRHRDDIGLTLFVPPVAWYRSVEFFWHKEYSGKRWEKTKRADAQMFVYFINTATDKEANKVKLNEEIEGFSKRISKYPREKREEVKRIFDDCMRHQILMYDDLVIIMSDYKDSGTFSHKKSEETKELEQKLELYGLKDYLTSLDNSWTYVLKQFEDSADESGVPKMKDNWEDLKELMALQRDNFLIEINRISEKIFE